VKAGKKSFVGPKEEPYRLPTLPHRPLQDLSVRFDLFLVDIPGPAGVPLPNVDWRIVRSSGENAARLSDGVLFSGRSDDSGAIVLSDADQKRLHDEWNRTPGRLWIVAESHVHQLVLSADRGSWTEQQKMAFALDAMGYSDTLGDLQNSTTGVDVLRLARQQTGASGGDAMLQLIKKGPR
jgi:type VI secretion system secreted protein VgrG